MRVPYSEEGRGRAAAPTSPLLAVPNVTVHPSTASVLMMWQYNCLRTLNGYLIPVSQGVEITAVEVSSQLLVDCRRGRHSNGKPRRQLYAVIISNVNAGELSRKNSNSVSDWL